VNAPYVYPPWEIKSANFKELFKLGNITNLRRQTRKSRALLTYGGVDAGLSGIMLSSTLDGLVQVFDVKREKYLKSFMGSNLGWVEEMVTSL
jgi:hypothetical protein